MSGNLLFVYGTLRNGGVNAITKLYPGSKFVGEATVRGRLFDMGGYPAVVLDENGAAVIGEVYEINDDTLAELDKFEEEASYQREKIRVRHAGSVMLCWVYRPLPEICVGKPPIESGDWLDSLSR